MGNHNVKGFSWWGRGEEAEMMSRWRDVANGGRWGETRESLRGGEGAFLARLHRYERLQIQNLIKIQPIRTRAGTRLPGRAWKSHAGNPRDPFKAPLLIIKGCTGALGLVAHASTAFTLRRVFVSFASLQGPERDGSGVKTRDSC